MIINGKEFDLDELAKKIDGGNPIANLMEMRQNLMDETNLSFDEASVIAREYYNLPKQDSSSNSNNLVIGIILSVIGLVGVIYQSSRISNDFWYSYSLPYSGHEMSMIAIIVAAAICLIIGLILVIKEMTKPKDKAIDKANFSNMSELNEKNDTASEISRFKELLDNGTITKDEFEAKKKKLLDL